MFIKLEDIDLHAAIPRQVHLALTGDPHEMTVMWATRTSNVLSIVECWPFDRPKRKKQFRGSIATLEGSPTVIHTVRIKGLHRGQKYGYRVGDPTIDTWCRDYWFETRQRRAPLTRFVALGDMDLYEDGTRRNIEYLKSRIMDFDMVIILGDISYRFGDALDEIEEALEPIAAIRPVMVLPGNHEYDPSDGLGFHHFNTRWHMPENGHLNQWYSWNMGNLHFVAISTEDSLRADSRQGRWLTHDLKMAAMREDYVIVLGHKTPIGSADKKWLNRKAHALWDELQQYLPTFQVRMSLWGHIHMYERTHPVGGTVYITIGVGGARLDTQVKEPQPEWSAYRHAEYGASFFTFDHINGEIHMQYCAAGTNEVLDQFSFMTTPHPESSLPRNHSADVFPILPLTEPPAEEPLELAKDKKEKKKDKPKDKPKEKKEEKPIPPKLNAAGEHITSDLKSPTSNKANEPHASNTGNPANAPASISPNPPSVAPLPTTLPGPLAATASTSYESPPPGSVSPSKLRPEASNSPASITSSDPGSSSTTPAPTQVNPPSSSTPNPTSSSHTPTPTPFNPPATSTPIPQIPTASLDPTSSADPIPSADAAPSSLPSSPLHNPSITVEDTSLPIKVESPSTSDEEPTKDIEIGSPVPPKALAARMSAEQSTVEADVTRLTLHPPPQPVNGRNELGSLESNNDGKS